MLRSVPRAARTSELIDRAIDAAIMAGLVVLILVGFVTSYRTLLDLAVTAGGYPRWLAPAVPLSFDLGIVVLSLKVARSAREGRTAPVMRLLVMSLSAATVLANASAAGTLSARLLHAVPPAMFVICFESVIISARHRALAAQGLLPRPLPRLRVAQWLLAPASTWRLWRNRVLALPTHPPPPDRPDGDRLARPRTPQSHPRLAPTTPLAETQPRNRDEVVREILVRDAAIAAPALRSELSGRGHAVSLRTAQRLIAAARPGTSTGSHQSGGLRLPS